MRALRGTVASALTAWWRRASRQAAALTYVMLQSMAPLLMVAVAVAGHWFGQDAAVTAVQVQVGRGFGAQSANVVGDLVQQTRDPVVGGTASVIGVAFAVWGASKVFASLTESLDEIFCEPLDTARRRGRRLRSALRRGLLHLAMVPVIGLLLCFLLAVSPVVHVVTAAVGWQPPAWVLHAIPAGVTAVLVAAAFWILPAAPKRARFLWIGAGAATVLFGVMRALLGVFMTHYPPSSVWGAASSLVVLLLWVYWSASMLFLGAELAEASANYFGTPNGAHMSVPACSGEGRTACSSRGV